jgi:hypothetical protein
MSIMRRSFVTGALVLCALIVLSLAKPAAANAESLWSDLPDDLLAGYGLTQEDVGAMSNGYPDGTWRPGEPVTRGQFVSLALRYFHIHPSWVDLTRQQHFSDVPRSSPHFTWVEMAFEVGLVQGYTSPSPEAQAPFGLYDRVTREQAITILMRYLSKMDSASFDYSTYTAERCAELLAPFSDKEQVRRTQEVAMAVDIGVLQPSDALRPQASLTRIQAAALIARTQGLLPPYEPPPTDPHDHSLWLLMSDAYLLSIDVDAAMLGSPAPWLPRTLGLRTQAEAGQDPAVYQETGEILVSLAERYKERTKHEQVRVVVVAKGGVVLYDHTFTETGSVPPAYPPMSSDEYHDFYYTFSGEGYELFGINAFREGDTWVIRLVIRVDAYKQTQATYDAIYEHATASAKEHGAALGENEILRIVLVEATPIPPMGEPEEKVIQSRDFDLTGMQALLDELREIAARAAFTIYYLGPHYRNAPLVEVSGGADGEILEVWVVYRQPKQGEMLVVDIASYDPAKTPQLKKPYAGWELVREVETDDSTDRIYRGASAADALYYVVQRGSTEVCFYGFTDAAGYMTAEQLMEIAPLLVPVL